MGTRLRRTKEEIQALVDEFHASGMTSVDFSREKGLKPGTLWSYLNRTKFINMSNRPKMVEAKDPKSYTKSVGGSKKQSKRVSLSGRAKRLLGVKLSDLVRIYGSTTALARELGVTSETVRLWKAGSAPSRANHDAVNSLWEREGVKAQEGQAEQAKPTTAAKPGRKVKTGREVKMAAKPAHHNAFVNINGITITILEDSIEINRNGTDMSVILR